MLEKDQKHPRAFKTAWFEKAARKARINDADLCDAIRDAIKGLADDLGGGVYKKRLNNNMHRSIILAKGGNYWIYAFMFAKKDMANITSAELLAFRELALDYAKLQEVRLKKMLKDKLLLEICHEKT